MQRATTVVRAWLPAALLAAFAAVLLGRLVQLQIIEHDEYAEAARSAFDGSATIYASRGAILDRNGNVLAMTVDTWDVYVDKNVWKDETLSPAEELSALLDIPPSSLIESLAEARGINVRVAGDISLARGATIEAAEIPGVTLDQNFVRFYPEGDLASSILGLLGDDNTGLTGIEIVYDSALRGTAGLAVFERDTMGEPIPYGSYVAKKPEPGVDLILTIDRQLQNLAEELLADAIIKHQAIGGDIIIVDPRTGEILALASLPTFGFSTLDLSDETKLGLLNIPSVTDMYEPGSVMKSVTAAAAIDRGVISPDTTYVDTGWFQAADLTIRNWQDGVYGEQTMTAVLQQSINTGSVYMVEQLGETEFHRYLDAFGFGHPTGIDLPGEVDGVVRTPSLPGYSPVDAFTQSFGQSIGVTPFQLLAAYSAIINGGNLVQPHVVKSKVSVDGVFEDLPIESNGQPISAETSTTVRRMLTSVIDRGFPHPGKPRDYTAGGKSGTANVPGTSGYDNTQIASFIGFAPADDPAILVLVKLDENRDFLTGTQAASPIFAEVANETLRYLGIEPEPRDRASTR